MAIRLNRHGLINIALILISCSLLVACGGGQVPVPKAAPAKDDDSKSVKAPPFPGKRYVLLVGVQAYGSREFPDLSFTENDVDELTTAMTQSGYFRENITVLTKNKAVPRDILQKLRAIADKCTKDDVLFVGFAGHGFERPNPSNPDQRQQFFCGYGARKDQPDTLVDLDQVYRILGDSRAGMKLIVMDACRNSLDRSLPPAAPGHSTVTSGNIPQGVLAFFSSSSGQRSYESPSLKHGVFFHYLIEAFQGKAQTRNGQLTWTDLIAHLNDHVTKYVKTELKQSQDWHFQGNVNIHLPLAEVASSKSPPKSDSNPGHRPGPSSVDPTPELTVLVLKCAPQIFDGCELFLDDIQLKYIFYSCGAFEHRALPGEHTIVVKKNGVIAHKSTFRVQPASQGKTYYPMKLEIEQLITLKAPAAVLKGVKINLDGREVKEWPAGLTETQISAEIGHHVVTIVALDGSKPEREILVEPGKPNVVDFGNR